MTLYVVHARTEDGHSGDRFEVEADTRDTAIEAYQTTAGGSALPILRVTTGHDTTTTDD